MIRWSRFVFVPLLALSLSCSIHHARETEFSPALEEKIISSETSTDWVLTPIEERFTEHELKWLRENRNGIQMQIVDYIRDGSVPAIQIAEHLKLKSALPILKEKLLTLREPYGWEGPDYSKEESYLFDEQYPYHQLYIHTIQEISGLPIHKAASLTSQEKAGLTQIAEKARLDGIRIGGEHPEAWCARWLLRKLYP